jgi:hypothetical protein
MQDGLPTDASSVAPELVSHVRQLQDDLRVLIRHVTLRADKSSLPSRLALASMFEAAGQAVSHVPASPDLHAGLIVLAPEAIARDGKLLGQLYAGVDVLTGLAAPADVSSIRLTRAFIQDDGDDEVLPSIRVKARRLQRWAWASAILGLLVFFIAVALLVHVDRGRRAVQQLQQVRAAYETVMNDFTVARLASAPGASSGVGPSECRDEPAEGAAAPRVQDRAGQQQLVLCGRLHDVQLRLSVVYRELLVWNTISERLSYASPVTWLSPRLAPVSGLSEEQWRSTELRTSVMMTALTGFVLPMLLGLLGACVYVYREIDDRIETYTLEAQEGVHASLRMLLGAILGGLLGAIWTAGQSIQLEGVSLSLGALAFFVGFSVEAVFRLVDSLVRTVAYRISKPTA